MSIKPAAQSGHTHKRVCTPASSLLSPSAQGSVQLLCSQIAPTHPYAPTYTRTCTMHIQTPTHTHSVCDGLFLPGFVLHMLSSSQLSAHCDTALFCSPSPGPWLPAVSRLSPAPDPSPPSLPPSAPSSLSLSGSISCYSRGPSVALRSTPSLTIGERHWLYAKE